MQSRDWDAALRGAGLRSTAQRRAVLRAVAELGHATVDEVSAHVLADLPDVSLSTVYRTLETLDHMGLVTHTHLHHGGPTYHSVDAEPHIHLVCTGCGAVVSQPADVAMGMAESVWGRTGFRVDLSHLALHGRCSRCLAAGSRAVTAEEGPDEPATGSTPAPGGPTPAPGSDSPAEVLSLT